MGSLNERNAREGLRMKCAALLTVFMLMGTSASAQFRATEWGMSPDEVIEAETASFISDQHREDGVIFLAFKGTLLDYEATIAYQFSDDGLMLGMYQLPTSAWSRLYQALQQRFGPPLSTSFDRVGWREGDTIIMMRNQFTEVSLVYMSEALNDAFTKRQAEADAAAF